jgi:hypothetical protein
MKKAIGIFVSTLLVTSVAVGDIYTDPTGDISTGNPNLDITQVEVTDDGIDLFVSMTVADLNADWGNYLLFINLPGYSGSGDNDNPWGRNISGLEGANYFIGSWLTGGGGDESYSYSPNNTTWSYLNDSYVDFSIDWSTSTVTWTYYGFVDYYDDTLSGIDFEVATTGGSWGDPAIDLLGGQGGNWGEGSVGAWAYYEFSTVPAPGAFVLLAVAGFSRRRRQ